MKLLMIVMSLVLFSLPAMARVGDYPDGTDATITCDVVNGIYLDSLVIYLKKDSQKENWYNAIGAESYPANFGIELKDQIITEDVENIYTVTSKKDPKLKKVIDTNALDCRWDIF